MLVTTCHMWSLLGHKWSHCSLGSSRNSTIDTLMAIAAVPNLVTNGQTVAFVTAEVKDLSNDGLEGYNTSIAPN